MEFFEEVRRLTITALFSDDVLFQQLVLKGGNAIALVHRLGLRSSFDLDFSLKSDFDDVEDARNRIQRALEARFDSAGYKVFDLTFAPRPKLDGPDERPWWGGYQLTFKLLTHAEHERLKSKPAKMQAQALPIASRQRRKLTVEISKYEYVEGKIQQDLDHYSIWVYTPTMVAAEKLRALCQQMPEYELCEQPVARARDFYDIFLAVTEAGVDLRSEESRTTISEMFSVKKVPLELLGRLESKREFHRPDWPSVTAAVPEQLNEFDFYFDFVLDQVRALEALWNK